tara:strand:+ start:7807 stop:7995 length:189 start_codon:yes stop_codon:yes gene_type:complete
MIKMDITMIALYVGLAGIVATGAYQIYKKYYLDDGKISLSELGGIVDDIKEVVEEVTNEKKK